MVFYNSLFDIKIEHKDVEPRNIMKDDKGEYRLIDYDLVSR